MRDIITFKLIHNNEFTSLYLYKDNIKNKTKHKNTRYRYFAPWDSTLVVGGKLR